jgi:hypothetical protein
VEAWCNHTLCHAYREEVLNFSKSVQGICSSLRLRTGLHEYTPEKMIEDAYENSRRKGAFVKDGVDLFFLVSILMIAVYGVQLNRHLHRPDATSCERVF